MLDLSMEVTVYVALVVVQLLVFWQLFRRFDLSWTAPQVDNDGEDPDLAAGQVRCSECGTVNEAPFRFCSHCVAELPRGATLDGGATGPRGRGMR